MGAPLGRVDCSAETYVAVCRACPVWRGAPQRDKAAAMADLAQHRRYVHPDQARDALKKAHTRGRR